MTTLLLLLVASLSFALYFKCSDFSRERAARRLAEQQAEEARRREDAANERMHAVGESVLRGHPAVKWTHPNPAPASDKYYWLHFEEGAAHLETEEARQEAIRRGRLLYHRKAV
jgi:hypothetical protein